MSGDFNNDGRPDLLTASNNGSSGLVRTLLNATTQPTFQLSAATYAASETDGAAVITVTRNGDASRPASVEYATSNVTASDRSDYTAAVGTLHFAAGETSRSFTVFITNDALIEGNETLMIGLGAPLGAGLGGTVTTSLTISSEDTGPSNNPNDDSQFYVRQHYRDFLGRDPDPSGLAFWTGEIEQCGADAGCREVKRIHVSAAFFLSIEFQQTGYLAYRARKAAFGNLANKPVPVTRNEMLQDVQSIGNGVVVNAPEWEERLEQNKRAYFDQLAASTRFSALYPQTLTPEAHVDALNQNAGGALSQAERDALVADLKSGVKTRAQALRVVAEDAELSKAEFNRAFVLMQYFGYLRRNPDDLPDHNFGGWQFWLSKLNEFNGDYIKAEMVKAFISSIEYRNRFGQ